MYRGYDEAVRRSLPPPKRPGTPSTNTNTGTGTSASTPASPAYKPTALPGPAPAPVPATAAPTPRLGQERKFRPQSLDGRLVDLKKHMQKKANSNHPFADREEASSVERPERPLMAGTAESEQPAPFGPKVGEGPSQDVTDLIFIIHGIGQGVRDIPFYYRSPSGLTFIS